MWLKIADISVHLGKIAIRQYNNGTVFSDTTLSDELICNVVLLSYDGT